MVEQSAQLPALQQQQLSCKGAAHGDATPRDGRPGEGLTSLVTGRSLAAASSDEDGHGCQIRTEVSGGESAPQRSTPAAYLANPYRPPGGGLARVSGAVADRAEPARQDTLGLVTADVSRPVCRLRAPHAGTPRAPVEGPARSGQGSILCPGASARPPGGLRFYLDERGAGDHP